MSYPTQKNKAQTQAGKSGIFTCVFEKVTKILTILSDRLNSFASWWLILNLALMSILIGAQVFCRYILNNSIFWSEEVGRILLVQITFLGASIAFKSGLHPSIRTLVDRFSLTNQRRIQLFTLAISLLFFVTLAWYGTHFALFISKQVTPSLGISKALPVAIIPLASAIAAIHALTAICETCKKTFEKRIDNKDTHILGTFSKNSKHGGQS